MLDANDPDLLASFQATAARHLPGLIGMEFISATAGAVSTRLEVRPAIMAANGYLHAATVVAVADTSCGLGAWLSLPEGASGFTTIELKTNFLSTVREGAITCEARLVHGGRTTQVWDATVSAEGTKREMALFRCTQAVLWPRTEHDGTGQRS